MIEPKPKNPEVLYKLAEKIGRNKRLNVGDILTPLDINCDPIGFGVMDGICRVVFPTEDGTNITKAFLRNGEFGVTPYRASASSANSYVEAVTISLLLTTEWSLIEREIKSSAHLHQAIEGELAAHTAWKTDRWVDDRTLTSKQRYVKLQSELGDDFDRIPLHMIASYIGVSPVQISRLRRELKNA